MCVLGGTWTRWNYWALMSSEHEKSSPLSPTLLVTNAIYCELIKWITILQSSELQHAYIKSYLQRFLLSLTIHSSIHLGLGISVRNHICLDPILSIYPLFLNFIFHTIQLHPTPPLLFTTFQICIAFIHGKNH